MSVIGRWYPRFDHDGAHRLIVSPASYAELSALIAEAIAQAVAADRAESARVAANWATSMRMHESQEFQAGAQWACTHIPLAITDQRARDSIIGGST